MLVKTTLSAKRQAALLDECGKSARAAGDLGHNNPILTNNCARLPWF
jgi:hypothetical protein